MDEFWGFVKIFVIAVAVIIIVFIVLLSLPNSPLRKTLLKIFGISNYAIAAMLIVYIVSPIDLVPDFIPVAGQIDDIAALLSAATTAATAWVSLKKSVEKIKR